ncbi:COG4223 family protein [Profundibacter sp.]
MATAKKPTTSKRTKTKDVVEDTVVLDEPEKDEKTTDTTNDDAPVKEKRKSAFMPLILGGVLSGAVGFGAATYYFTTQPSEEAQELAKVRAVLEDHKARLDGADETIGGLHAGLEGRAAAAADGFAQSVERDEALALQFGAVTAAIAEFDARLITLEKRPLAEAGGITGDAAKAYERELRTMRDLLEVQRSDIEKLAAEATARIEGVAAQAATSEEAATAMAKVTAVKVAISQLQSALDNGGAFEAAVANLTGIGVDVPAVLAGAAKGGVPTLADLQESYPAAARAALAVSVKATTGDGAMGKIGSFFRSQVGARSLEPREGDDPDAVLSRSEAALGAGDIAGTIALIGALPDVGQTMMTDWVNGANTRMQALDAVRELADGLNGN